jgi:hypothetical protein
MPKKNGRGRSKAVSVRRFTVPPIVFASMSGVTALTTSMFATIDAGRRSSADARSVAVDASGCPLSVTLFRFGATPRIDTVRPSPRVVSMYTPGTRCTASATFWSGRSPISSAAITSLTVAERRFWSAARSWPPRSPVTLIPASVVGASSSATVSRAVAPAATVTACSAGRLPSERTTTVRRPAGTATSRNTPPRSVVARTSVPTTETSAAVIGFPSGPVTRPSTRPVAASTACAAASARAAIGATPASAAARSASAIVERTWRMDAAPSAGG